MFYLTTHSTHFIYSYMASDIWLRTILIVREETRYRHICYSYRLTARVLLYAPSHRQDNTYHSLCYTSRGALAAARNRSMGQPHEGSIRWPIAPWANALPLSYVPLFLEKQVSCTTYLDVEMDDAVLVHVFESLAHLPHVIDDLCLRHFVILSCDSVEQLPSRQTENNQHINFIDIYSYKMIMAVYECSHI